MARPFKVPAITWVETAREIMIEEGAAGVKIERLARRLGVTRGGFYYSFRHRKDLLDQLLRLWETSCNFLPCNMPGSTFAEADEWLDLAMRRLIEEDGYDHRFDMAVREWGRSEQRVAWAVERGDRQRISTLQSAFALLGYDAAAAATRARIFYFHQIGYYAIGVRQNVAQRRRDAHLYVDLLIGAALDRKAVDFCDEPGARAA